MTRANSSGLWLGIGVLLCCVCPGGAQQSGIAAGPSPQASSLDQMLAKAMDRNATIIAAKTTLAMADAELRNARIEVARQLVMAKNEIAYQEAAIASLHGKLERAEKANKERPGTFSDDEIEDRRTSLIEAKAKLSQSEDLLKFLVGDAPLAAEPISVTSSCTSTSVTVAPTPQMPRGPMVEKIRQLLDQPTEVEFVETPFVDVVGYLKSRHQIEIQLDRQVNVDWEQPITVSIRAPFAAAVQLFEDTHPPMKWVLRDYGILVTSSEVARNRGYLTIGDYTRMVDKDADVAKAVGADPKPAETK